MSHGTKGFRKPYETKAAATALPRLLFVREQESPETFGVICGGLDTAPFFHVDRFPGISREMPFNMKRSQDPDPEQGGVVIFQVSRLFTLHLLHLIL
ncbi:hypothetical protein EI42_01027 [Thermosporothrix hazakensis]|jgi:hypothetical protein|uniref:Uncharacterized protein n=1 Tax=Thermosporothrix hazakensis TaxID=644383 RepID=A0A326UGF1_THEHA|nr:hypothetical protein EI42_01027 [Thermosporothrix hazakensis]